MSTADIGLAVILVIVAAWHLGCKYLNYKYGSKPSEARKS